MTRNANYGAREASLTYHMMAENCCLKRSRNKGSSDMNDKKKEVRGSNKAVSMRDLAVCPLTVCDVRFRSPMVLSGDNPYLMFP